MAENESTPLTEDERAELEQLRAEKARREEEARARRERAELEQLRAEMRAEAQDDGERPAAPAQSAPASKPAPDPKPAPRAEAEDGEPVQKTFGVRMVTSDTVDKDGIPTMPMAQKIIMVACAVIVIGYIYLYLL